MKPVLGELMSGDRKSVAHSRHRERALQNGDDSEAKGVQNPNPARVSVLPQEVGSSRAAG